jgi:UDP-N-acetylmuramyl pentapeptide phosphotransferase/UDP-N-acetylglucosamine-1-phosphate transferase
VGDLAIASCWIALGVTIGFGVIGFYDDYLKLVVGNSRGPDRALEVFLAVGAGPRPRRLLYRRAFAHRDGFLRAVLQDRRVPLGAVRLRRAGYLMIVGMSNAVNLTDGLDGLAIMPAVMVAGALGIFAYASGNAVFANYLQIPRSRAPASCCLLRRAGRRGPGLPVVQLLSGAGVHGRHRRAGARRGARRASASSCARKSSRC